MPPGTNMDAAPLPPQQQQERREAGRSLDRPPSTSEFDALAGWGTAAQKERAAQNGAPPDISARVVKKVFASTEEELAYLRQENYRILKELQETGQELEESKARHAADLEVFSPAQIMGGTGLDIYRDSSQGSKQESPPEQRPDERLLKKSLPPTEAAHDSFGDAHHHGDDFSEHHGHGGGHGGGHGHGRSVEHVEHKIVSLRKPPQILDEEHEETFFELFYDLILVVVFIKLSYVKYDFTASGLVTICVIFGNFWSCWSLMNVYVTMLHGEDLVHRLYYIAHIGTSFVMAVTLEQPSDSFFNYNLQSWYHACASIICRSVTLFMWIRAYIADLEATVDEESMNAFTKKKRKAQVMVHAGSIFVSILLFLVTLANNENWAFSLDNRCAAGESRRRLGSTYSSYGSSSYSSSYSSYSPSSSSYSSGSSYASSYSSYSSAFGGAAEEDCDDGIDERWRHHMPVTVLWLTAIIVETVGSAVAAIYMKLPFAGDYAGERMQAWLMLCFGESVIALLVEPIYYASSEIGALLAAFTMILCLCTAYFDIVDADQFLHLFIVRREKIKSVSYMLIQYPFSVVVFLTGVALKIIMFTKKSVFQKQLATGCNVGDHETLSAHRRLLFFDIMRTQAVEAEGDEEAQHHRRLAGAWAIDDLNDLHFKAFLLLCISVSLVMTTSLLIGYAMPISLPPWRVHLSRIGAIIISCLTLLIPFNLRDLVTPCLAASEEAHRRLAGSYSSYSSFDSSEFDDDSLENDEKLSTTQGLVTVSMLILASFIVALGSLDHKREESYAKLEEEAQEEAAARFKAKMEKRMRKANLVIGVASHLNKASARISKERNEASSKGETDGATVAAGALLKRAKQPQSGAPNKGDLV